MKRIPFPSLITDVCREFFGTYIAKRSTWSPPNRCDSCPIRTPCNAHGGRPARTFEELSTSRATFVREALVIIQPKPGATR